MSGPGELRRWKVYTEEVEEDVKVKNNGPDQVVAETKKVLGDINNSQGIFQKNEAVDGSKPGKGKMERIPYSQRKSAKSYCLPQRKSLPVLMFHDKAKESDIKKGNKDDKLKNKEKHGFLVKPKVGTMVVPQINNDHERRWKNRDSDGCIRMNGKMERVPYSQRASVSGDELKVFNDNSKTRDQETGYLAK